MGFGRSVGSPMVVFWYMAELVGGGLSPPPGVVAGVKPGTLVAPEVEEVQGGWWKQDSRR